MKVEEKVKHNLLDHVRLEFVGPGKGLVALRALELLLGVKSPNVLPDLGIFTEALKKITILNKV